MIRSFKDVRGAANDLSYPCLSIALFGNPLLNLYSLKRNAFFGGSLYRKIALACYFQFLLNILRKMFHLKKKIHRHIKPKIVYLNGLKKSL